MRFEWDEYRGGQSGYMAVGEKLRIADANLDRLDMRLADLSEMRYAIIREKVLALLSAISIEYPMDVFDRLVREERFPETFRALSARQPRTFDEAICAEDVARVLSAANDEERLLLCRELAHACDRLYLVSAGEYNDRWVRQLMDLIREDERMDDNGEPDLEARTPRPVGERIAYLRNTYTDLAYETFSSVLSHTSSTYYSDFPGVCEALYYERATACILPMENSTDGKLLRFYSLMTKYDLRIAYITQITAWDTDVTTRYALLRRAVSVPYPDKLDAVALFFECRIMPEEDMPLYRILAAADAYHFSLSRIDTVPSPYEDDDRTTYDLILRAEDGADFVSLLTYFYLLVQGFTLLGIYPEIAST